MNLYEMTMAAASEVAAVRNPNVDDWREAIDAVLTAAGECTVGNDEIENISMSDSTLRISTSYVLRGCAMENDINIPMPVVMAKNPVKAAHLFRLDSELGEAKAGLEKAVNKVASLSAKVAELEQEMAGFSADDADI